jgi:hypothetical protein
MSSRHLDADGCMRCEMPAGACTGYLFSSSGEPRNSDGWFAAAPPTIRRVHLAKCVLRDRDEAPSRSDRCCRSTAIVLARLVGVPSFGFILLIQHFCFLCRFARQNPPEFRNALPPRKIETGAANRRCRRSFVSDLVDARSALATRGLARHSSSRLW